MKSEKENYYVRFGKIPVDEQSGIYRCDEGQIGKENGVSCYRAFVENEKVYCILSLKEMYDTCVYNNAENSINGFYWKADDNDCAVKRNFSVYLITGDEVGFGSSGEPLLKNVNIVTELFVEDGCLTFKEHKDEI